MFFFFSYFKYRTFALAEFERYLYNRRLTDDFTKELNTKRNEEEKQRKNREQSEERQRSLRSWNATANNTNISERKSKKGIVLY